MHFIKIFQLAKIGYFSYTTHLFCKKNDGFSIKTPYDIVKLGMKIRGFVITTCFLRKESASQRKHSLCIIGR